MQVPPIFKNSRVVALSLLSLGAYGLWVSNGNDTPLLEVVESPKSTELPLHQATVGDDASFVSLKPHVHDSGKGGCSGHAHDHHVIDESVVKENSATWDAQFVTYLKKEHPKHTKGIELITRAVTQENYKLLPEEDFLRLLEYAEFASTANAMMLPHLCWGETTFAPVKSAFDQVRFAALSEGGEGNVGDPEFIFQAPDRWNSTATDGATGSNGTPVTLTWGFVPDGTTVPNGSGGFSGSELITELNATYGVSPTGNLEDAPWFEMFETAFSYWAEVTGNTYVYESNDDGGTFAGVDTSTGNSGAPGVVGTRADVRIGGTNIDGNSNTLAFNYSPDSGDMVIDTQDTSNFTNNASTKALLRNVIAHEHGHGLGFKHVCPVNQTKLMEPSASTSFVGVQFDDMLTAQGKYGDKLERSATSKDNNSVATATDLGVLSSTHMTDNVSISRTGDVDLYKFQVPSGKSLTVTAAPTAVTPYLEGAQVGGSCSAGTNFDPRNRQNLSIRLLDLDGTTVLASANSAPIAMEEEIGNAILSAVNKSYYIEVTGGGENNSANNNAQAYSLNLSFSDANTLEASDLQIISEACGPFNDAIDPDEQVTVRLTVSNTGSTSINAPVVTLQSDVNLTVAGASSQTLAALAVGQSATVDFSFSLAGNCGDSRTLSFQLAGGTAVTSYSHQLNLGKLESAFSANFEASSSLPSGLTSVSGNASAAWGVSDEAPLVGSRSVFATGVDGSGPNSAYLETNSFTVSGEMGLSFRHSYDFETSFDGGFLEIKIGTGAWTEWITAGGSITENGYDGTISRSSGTLSVWTDNSGGALVTKATFPSSAVGESVQVRWIFDSDFSVASGDWKIDDIDISGYGCCDGAFPVLSVSASDAEAGEFDLADTAEFSISSSVAPTTSLPIAYTVSGSATSGSDFVALAGSTSISAGSQVVLVPVTALVDSVSEGDETVVLTLSNSADYAISTASATITIKDLPFDEYREENFGSATVNVADDEDFDGDGELNLVEYALGQDPTQPNAVLTSTVTEDQGVKKLSLTFEENMNLADVNYILETSDSLGLNSWSTIGVIREEGPLVDGKRMVTASIDISAARKFLRLRIARSTAQ